MGRRNVPSSWLDSLLRAPLRVTGMADSDWNDVMEAGRHTQLLGQLSALIKREHLSDSVPDRVSRHLELAELTARRRGDAALWEVASMRRAVDPAVPLVLLKGCAYVACVDINAAGRIFSDMDVLVRRQDLPAVEADLTAVGWKPAQVNDYDSGYYRNWMHEVPPMEHVRRHTVVDLHHAINPPVSRYYINSDSLLDQVIEVSRGIFVLCPKDRVIHCALHLLQGGESHRLMRDLYDLHLLVQQHHGSVAGVEQLERRARELKVAAPVGAAIGAANALFSDSSVDGEWSGWLQVCIGRAARGASGNHPPVGGALAGSALLAYAHWIKMPLHILVPHLVRKSILRMTSDNESRLAKG
jgi:hypothetical protein